MNTVPIGGKSVAHIPHLIEPDSTALAALQSLYDSNQHLEAYRSLGPFAPLDSWRQSLPALIFGGRLAHLLGDAALSDRLHQRAYRLAPHEPEAAYYFALRRWHRHGPLEALHFLRSRHRATEPATLVEAHLLLIEARALSLYRDFSAAADIVDRVLARFPKDSWCWVEKSYVIERTDNIEAALAAATEADSLRPWYRPAVHARAQFLQTLNRDDEAITLLQQALPRVRSGSIAQSLVVALEEQARHSDILPLLDQIAELLPLADRNQRAWIEARRCDAAHRSGRAGLALCAAQKVDTVFYRQIAAQLSLPEPAGPRVQLPVGFVRQHHMTCAPATLAALSQFWGVPAEQSEIARIICYDGSPDHEERHWAESAGWVFREFAADWPITRSLLDRGCPFAIVTTETESAHMQAVVGYDATLETVLIRDPYRRDVSEWHAPSFFRNYAAHGPRATLLLPRDRANLLADLSLPDSALYDQLYRVRRSLHGHDRAAALAACEAMQASAPEHRLTLEALCDLAYYDGRPSAALPAVRRIRERFPEDYTWRLRELQLLARLGHTTDRRALVLTLGSSTRAPVAFRREYALELLRDARTQSEAGRILRSLLRRQSVDASLLRAYSRFLWDEQRHGDSTDLLRLAATLGDKTEYLWSEYFRACRHLGRTDEGLALLRRRFASLGGASSQPATTLFQCLDLLDRTDEGLAVLEEAARLRPEDGELMLFHADACARVGRNTRVDELLTAARSRASHAAWCRTAARIAGYRAEHLNALAHWRELQKSDPTDSGVHAAIATLLARTAGRAEAIAHLRSACHELPHHAPIARLVVDWLRDAPAETAMEAIEHVLRLDPVDAWALREKALTLRRLVRLDEALASAELALRIDPDAPASHGVLGDVLQSLRRPADAHASYLSGIRRSIEATWLYESLLATCDDYEARRATVNILQREILLQPFIEEACHHFRLVARPVLSAEELTACLLEFRTRRPESWSAWSGLVNNLVDTRRLDEALEHARDATARFALTPRPWLDLGLVHDARGEYAEAVSALETALALNPTWTLASRRLSQAYEHKMDFERAQHAIERAINADPTEAINHAWMADLHWRRKRPAEAIAAITRAVRLRVDYDWAWDRLADWARLTQQPELPREIAQELTESMAGEANLWLRIAQLHFSDPVPDASLRALDRAAELDVVGHEAWDLRAQLLTQHRRYEDALAACHPAAFGEHPPRYLRGRAAWIERQRGRFEEAITAMQALVAEHPDYVWAWIQLAEWNWVKERHDAAQAAVERWAWLSPESPVPQGYLAALHLKAGRRREAKEAFSRAIARDPVYDYAAFELLQLHLDDAEIDDACRVCTHIEAHFSKADSLVAQIRVALVQRDRAKTCALLADLAHQPAHTADRLQNATERILSIGWREDIARTLRPLLARTDVLPEVGASWFRAREHELLPLTLWALRSDRVATGPRQHALGALLSHLAAHGRDWRLRAVIALHRRFLHAHLHTWGQTGYALVNRAYHQAAFRWLQDWRERDPRPESWMLHNYVLACFATDHPAEGAAALDALLHLPADNLRAKHLHFHACERALAGETLAAQAALAATGTDSPSDFYVSLRLFTEVLIATQNAPLDQRPTLAREGAAKLSEAIRLNTIQLNDPTLRYIYRRVLSRLGQDGSVRWLRIRSRLPVFSLSSSVSQGSNSSGSSSGQNWWMWWVVFVALSTVVRNCSHN